MQTMQTYSAKPSDIERKWYLIDATDLVLGRLSATVATLLQGKHKPLYSPNIDCGDHVIIINAEKIHLTGKKHEDKIYYRHTGHPGGIKETTPRNIIEGKFPERVVIKSVQRMLSRGPLSRAQMLKLHVYTGSEHPHEGQKPQLIDFAKQNRKNKKSNV